MFRHPFDHRVAFAASVVDVVEATVVVVWYLKHSQLDINQKHVDDRTFLNAVECAAKSEGCINAFYLESIFREACPNQSSYSKI